MMRVLFFLYKVDCNDGIASYCYTLASSLQKNDVQVDIVCGSIHSLREEDSKRLLLEKVISCWMVLPGLSRIPKLLLFLKIRRLIIRNDISVINIHGLGMLVWGKILSLLVRKPVVATYHPSIRGEIDQLSVLADKPFTFAERLVLRWCAPDRLIVLSEESAKYLAQQCPAIASRIVKVSGAVDDEYFRIPTDSERHKARANLHLLSNDLVVLHVGRMSWNKGQYLVVDAVRRAALRLADIHIDPPRLRGVFVGSGELDTEKLLRQRAFRQDSGGSDGLASKNTDLLMHLRALKNRT